MDFFRLFYTVWLTAVVSLSISAFAENTLEDFAKPFEYHDAVLSPTGEYIAVQREAEHGKQLVAVLKTEDLSLLSHIPATTGVSPFNPTWISDDRYVVQFTEQVGARDFEFSNGELFASNANGKKQRRIIEHQRFLNNTDSLNTLHGYATVAHRLPKEKKKILIRFQDWRERNTKGSVYKLLELNSVTGKFKHVTTAPSYAANFTFDKSGKPLYSIGFDKKSIKKERFLAVHRYENEQWVEVEDISIEGAEGFSVVSVGADSNTVYLHAWYDHSTDKIFRYNLRDNTQELVFHHPRVDPTGYYFDGTSGELVAVHFDDGYPDVFIVNKNHPVARWYAAFYQYFNGLSIEIRSTSDDYSKIIVYAYSDREPGQFHLFDTKTKKMRYLFNSAGWIEPDSLARVKPISFENRGGTTIHGYLTLPTAVKDSAAKAPLIVMPHGGPHGVRDYFEYDREVQFLASQGYAVLQMNFRGSGGYGHGFEVSTYRQWGDEIQYDIIDATKWAGEHANIDASKTCIVGGSFGGYSALMSPIIEPGLFKCAVGVVGVYDLGLMWKTGDIKRTEQNRSYLRKAIGEDEDEHKKFSPLYNLDRLKTPVFIVHGKKDYRVDVKHYEKLKDALEERSHPHETLLFDKEGHGFASEENRAVYFTRLAQFLDSHLKN